MNLAVWAERNGVAWVIAYRWFRAGLLPVPAQRVGRLILVNDPAVEESGRGRTLVYARDRQRIRGPIWIGGSRG
ncbi:resolvase [Mycobacterium tuberculosis]|nr:resolvase [Mycobacterium tuberculosis]